MDCFLKNFFMNLTFCFHIYFLNFFRFSYVFHVVLLSLRTAESLRFKSLVVFISVLAEISNMGMFPMSPSAARVVFPLRVEAPPAMVLLTCFGASG